MEKCKETKEGGRWIPVAEGMPQKNCLYLITYENASGRHSDAAFYDPDPGAWFWDEEETQKVQRKILAWRPLPAPYQPKQ